MSQQSNNIIASQVAAQEESVSSEYMQNIREIRTRVALGFYSNSSEDTGTVCVNRSGWVGEDGVIHPPIDDAFANKRNQLITYGLTSKKYAVLDGSSKLGDCMVADMSGDAFMGVWSNTLSNDDGVFRVAPVFSVEYVAARSLTEVMVKGFEPYNQFPVAYDIVLDVSSTEVDASQLVDATAGNDEVGVFYKTCVAQFIGNRAVFSVGQGAVPNSCDHVIRFAHPTSPDKLWNVKFHKMSLVVKKWNIGGRSAKIMYFSREKNFILYDRDISSITVFEEKSKAADKLEYGLTSNSCTVSLLDRGDRFTRNPDLLKRNRSINPAVDIVKQGEQPLDPSEREYQSLGRFYSDTWTMDAKSKFITCKAYDELMSLQSIVLSFPYQEVNGVFKIATDVDVYDLYCQIFEQINSKKHIQELYGVDIIYKIDPRLRGTKVPYLLLSERSAWETLQDLAAFSLCHIYCTRGGEVHVVCDIPPQAEQVMSADTDTLHDLPPSVTISDAKILPVNSFTYQLPVQSKTLVNRVVMPYIEITDDGKAEDNTIEIKKDSIETVSYVEGGVTKQKMVFTVELKNFYKEINSFTLNNITEVGEQIVETSKILIFFDKAYFEFNKIEITEKLVLKINVEKTNLNINRMKVIKELPDKTSIKANGVSEYTHPDSYLLVSLENAVAKSNLILHKYNNGVAYIETDWIGTPNLSIGSRIACQGLRDASPKIYEALSNEFTLNGGLRCKTKLSEGQT